MSSSASPSEPGPAAGGYRRPAGARPVGWAAAALVLLTGAGLAALPASRVRVAHAPGTALLAFDVPRPEAASPARPRPPERPQARPARTRATPPAPGPRAPATAAAAPPVPAPARMAPVPAPPALPSVPAISPAAAPPAKPDDAALRTAYAARLWAHIATRRPRGIRLAGTATLAFTVDRTGGASAVAIAAGSGNAMLDRLALRTLERATPLPPPPPELPGDRLRFTIAFRFD